MGSGASMSAIHQGESRNSRDKCAAMVLQVVCGDGRKVC